MRMRCGLEFAFASHSRQCELPEYLASHANSHSHRITSPAGVFETMQHIKLYFKMKDFQHIIWYSKMLTMKRNCCTLFQKLQDLRKRWNHGLFLCFSSEIPSNSSLFLEIESPACQGTDTAVNYLEHVQAVLTINATRRGAIQMFLTSPMGTRW